MKAKYIFLLFILAIAILCFNAINAKALTIEEVIIQINTLQSKIKSLKESTLQQTNENVVQPQPWCHDFIFNLGFVNSGAVEVGELHKALAKEGISYFPDKENIYSVGTAKAVQTFQQKYRIYPANSFGVLTGYVGQETRKKLNELYGCKLKNQPVVRPLVEQSSTLNVLPNKEEVSQTSVIQPTPSVPLVPSKDVLCVNAGGTVLTQICHCQNGIDFYSNCGYEIGYCSCAPSSDYTKKIKVCNCGEGKCWNGSTCVDSSSTKTPLNCENLKASPLSASYFSTCREQGFDKICFNKYDFTFQACGKSSYSDCVANNANAAANVWCDSSDSLLTCSDLQKNNLTASYFLSCKNKGFDRVCFNKYSGVYQGCGKFSYNDCTANNANSALNIWCDASDYNYIEKNAAASILGAFFKLLQGLLSK